MVLINNYNRLCTNIIELYFFNIKIDKWYFYLKLGKAFTFFRGFKVIKQLSSSLDLHLSGWKNAFPPSLWLPPCLGMIKGNFDVAVRDSFEVAAAVVSDTSGNVILAATLKLFGSDVLQEESTAALFAGYYLPCSFCFLEFC